MTTPGRTVHGATPRVDERRVEHHGPSQGRGPGRPAAGGDDRRGQDLLARRHLGHDPRRDGRRAAHRAGRARHRDRLPRQPHRELLGRRPRAGAGGPRPAALLVASGWNIYLATAYRPRSRRSCSACSWSSCSCAASSRAAADPHGRDDRRDRDPGGARAAAAAVARRQRRRAVPAVHRPALHGGQRPEQHELLRQRRAHADRRARSCSSGLALFFRFSAIGVALRGSSENADRASLLGIPVRRLQSVVWGLVGLLAFVAMFLRIGVDGPQLGQVLNPTLLLSALGAAVIGRMERLPTDHVLRDRARHRVAGRALPLLVGGVPLGRDRGDHRVRVAGATVDEPLPPPGAATSTWQETREVQADPGRAPPRARGAHRPVGARRAPRDRPRTDPDAPARATGSSS